MAKNIKEIADGIDAKIIGQVPKVGGGAFGAAKVAKDADALAKSAAEMRAATPNVKQIIEDLKAFSRGNTLGDDVTIRDLIEEGRRF